MRILVISNYYPPVEVGGWDQLTQDVALQLKERGHDVFILTSRHRSTEISQPEPHIARILYLESPDHIHYHPHYILLRAWWERQNQRWLAQTVRTFKPDLIFINGMWNLPVSLAMAAEKLLPKRVVYYMASTWPAELDAHRAYWTSATSRSWQPIKQVVKKLACNMLPSQRRNQLLFEHVLCVSAYIRDYLVEQAGIPHEQTKVVYNGVDLQAFTMRNLAENHPTVRLLYAGRLVPDKGVHTVIAALGELLHLQTRIPVTLTILGSGAPDYEEHLRTLVASFNLEKIVEFRGQVPREVVPDILVNHDVLVLPSIWQEPLARMTQEAMACGVVVIGTTTGGTPEILHDYENGLTFTAGDASMLADKIRTVVDRELRIRLACAARHTVEKHFDFVHMVDKIESYFLTMLAHDRTP